MSLDLTKVAPQVDGMVVRLKGSREARQKQLHFAIETLSDHASDLENLKKKIESSKTTWLVAELVEKPDSRYSAPPIPTDFTVIATDGSHIDVDRHRSARCYLINIGWAVLRYGTNPEANLDSLPCLCSQDDDLTIKAPGTKLREQPVEGPLLGIKRSVEEVKQLAELAVELPPGSDSLALLDGSLILWGLEAYPEFVTDVLLHKGFLNHLEEVRKLNQDRCLTLASYISSPRSTDVVNALRVVLCPRETVNSDRYCPTCQTRECEAVTGVLDQQLFFNLLDSGERSALFISQSSISRKHYGDHQVHFFYLRANDEIARVEIPAWVANDESRLNLAHALILDQCWRGQGYPTALSEAHEQAVVTTADREEFWQLVESLLIEKHLPTPTSAKSFSKRTRWV